MFWMVYSAVVLVISGFTGWHLGRFREAYTEMTGMMAGMTMGMLNGFLLGYAIAGFTSSMFWGNLVGIVLGALIGGFFGRAGSLMGIMDGAMGGVMGGSMGAMLLVMLVWPVYMYWTAALLGVVYVLGMFGLVLLIEKSAPEHAALHRLLPAFARMLRLEAFEPARSEAARRALVDDYYTFLGVGPQATGEEVTAAYLEQLSIADEATVARAERAYSILTDPVRRHAYDARLSESQARGDCCPPPRRKTPAASVSASASVPARARAEREVPARRPVQPKSPGRRRRAEREAPISWVGATSALFIVAALTIWWVMNQAALPASGAAAAGNALTDTGRALPAEFVQKLENQAVTVPVGVDGKQTMDVAVSGSTRGYTPSVLRLKKGVPASLNISVEGADPGCGRVVTITALRARAIAVPGQVVPMEFTPDKTGIFQINCDMQMMDPGYVIVTD